MAQDIFKALTPNPRWERSSPHCPGSGLVSIIPMATDRTWARGQTVTFINLVLLLSNLKIYP